MRYAVFFLAGLSLLTGLVAAWYWYQSSTVPVVPMLDEGPAGAMNGVVRSALGGLRASMETSATLNKEASLWTAASVILGAFGNFIGLLVQNRK